MSDKQLKTAKEIKAEMEAKGINLSDWARRHDLDPRVVLDVLSGRRKGRNGEAHKAAVLLGLKDGIVEE